MSGEVATSPAAPVVDQNAALLTQVQGVLGPAIQAALAPLQARQEQLAAEIQGLGQTRSASGVKASQLFGGGAPAIRQGENPLTSRGYSFGRLLFALDPRNPTGGEFAKVEIDINNKLRQVFGAGREGVLAPLGGAHLQCADPQLAAECQQLVRAGVGAYDPQELAWQMQRMSSVVRQDFSTITDDAGGILLGPTQQGEMIDLLRAKEAFSRAGSREITLPPNGRISWPRHKTAGTGYWVGEGQAITESNMTFGGFVMQAKKLAAILDLPNEMFRFITMSIEAFIRTEIAKTLALKLDTSCISAVGSALEPKGLLNYTTSGNAILTYTASTVAADGNTFEPQDIFKMSAKVEEQNVDVNSFTFLMRPLLYGAFRARRADAVTAGDAKGPFVFQTADNRLNGIKVVTTTQVPADVTKGSSGATLTHVIGGDFSEWLIGRVGVLEFALDPYSGVGGTNFKNDMTSIRAIQHVDAACRRPEAFIDCTELLNA